MSSILWQPGPERVAAARLSAFRERVEREEGVALPDAAALHRWSVERPERFWPAVWRECGLPGEPGGRVLVDGEHMPGARWFPDARLSYAEALLARRDDAPALVLRDEGGGRRAVSFDELAGEVAALAAALRAAGVGPGDRVAGWLPNVPEAVVALLATSAVGATWASCSPDFGAAGVVDRLGQVAPRVLLVARGHRYAGKAFPSGERLREALADLPSVERVLVVPWPDDLPDVDAPRAEPLEAFVAPHRGAPLACERLPFDQPLAILFSSGTTGRPKCIVHSAGGTLLQHAKEHALHCDVRAGDRVLYFTTLGWMMWNWLVSALAQGATVVLYEGSPAHPAPDALLDVADEERLSFLGASARWIDGLRRAGVRARTEGRRLDALRTLASTGSPLAPACFDWVWDELPDVHLASISGGTDIVSCFVLGDPTRPVRRGEIQGPGLGMAVDVFDDDGRPLRGAKGELVCTRPFPSMPLGFLDDPGGARYRAAYFERFPGVWHHGDLAEVTPSGGFVIHGRSDTVLNPGGVRIGTAEIYRQLADLDEVEDAVAVGQAWEGDVRVVLFLVLRGGASLDDALVERIRRRIRERASPRHVPARVLAVPDVPRTRSGKVSEVAAREAVHGRDVANATALANPEVLAHFRGRPELAR